MSTEINYDVIIIGGSYAGLSAAMALGRSLRKVLIIDGGKPCNRYTPHSHNFITHDGAEPATISAIAKNQVLAYETVTFLEGKAIAGKMNDDEFEITTEDGQKFKGRKIILAGGIADIFPETKGFESLWGKSVIHCPYCHGYEFKNQKTAIWAPIEKAMHLVGLIHNLSKDVSIIPMDNASFTDEQLVKLKQYNIPIIDKKIQEWNHTNGQLQNIIFEDGSAENFDTAYASIPFQQHNDLANQFACEHTDLGHIKVDNFQKTSVPGIYACGDNCSMMRSVANAVATGNLAGVMVNNELIQSDF